MPSDTQPAPTVSATHLVELACQQFLRNHPDVPIVLQSGIYPNYSYTRTPAGATKIYDQWSVRLIASLDGVMVSGSGPLFVGVNDCIGDTALVPHGTSWREPDANVILSEAFQAAILAAVQTKAAEVAADYASRTAKR